MRRVFPLALASSFLVVAAVNLHSALGQSTNDARASVAQKSIASASAPVKSDAAVTSEGQKYYETGLRLYESGKFVESLDVFREATRFQPGDAHAYYMLGMAQARLHSLKDAADSFKRAVRFKPDWAEAHFRLGIVSHVLGNREQAGKAFTALQRGNPKLADLLYRTIQDETNRASVAAQIANASGAWLSPIKSQGIESATANVPAAPAKSPEHAAAPSGGELTAADAALATIYRVGVGDVLDIRLVNAVRPRSTLYTVIEGGLIDYPVAGGAIVVAGLTVDEIQTLIATELKRRAVEEGARVSVGVRQYASHSVSITGLVSSPGTKFLRREAVPLYVLLAEAQARQDAGRVTIIRSAVPAGEEVTLDLSEPASLNYLIKPGDMLTLSPRPQQFYYIGGKINYPGQKNFQAGITLLQAILAAGGPTKQGDNVVELSREEANGRLVTTRLKLKEIKGGQLADPRLQVGDRIDVVR